MFASLFQGIDERVIKLKRNGKLPGWKVWGPSIFALVMIFASVFVQNETFQLIIASFGGFLLFIGSYLVWLAGLSEEKAELLAVRQRYDVFYRRRVSVAFFIFWVILTIVASRVVPASILGGFSVFVILTIFHVFTPTEEEREETQRIENEIYDEKLREAAQGKTKKGKGFLPEKASGGKGGEYDEWEGDNVDDSEWENGYQEEDTWEEETWEDFEVQSGEWHDDEWDENGHKGKNHR